LLIFNEHSLNKKSSFFFKKFVKVPDVESLTKSAVRNAMLNSLEINVLFSGKSSQRIGRKVTENVKTNFIRSCYAVFTAAYG